MHAGCMQAACSLHAACMQAATSCMQDAATCNLLRTIVCRLHAGCMQPACSLLHPACSLLQPAATCNLLHTIVFTKCATIGTTFRRPRRAGRRRRRAGRRRLHFGGDSLQKSDHVNHVIELTSLTIKTGERLFIIVNSMMYNIQLSCHTHYSRTAFHQCEFDRAQIATLKSLSQSRQANCFSLNWILWLDINNIYGLMTLSTFCTSTQKCEIFSYWFITCVSKNACKSQTD